MDITIIITLMKTCQSCVLTPAKSPFLVMIFFKFAQILVSKFNFPHYFFDNIALLLRKHPWNWVYINLFSIGMKLDDVFHCMVAFLNVLQYFKTLSLSLLSCSSHHKVSVTFFPICIVSNKWAICRCS